MSAVYNLEPQPTAKVLLQTTAGDILLELFAKQTPLAARNFLQHCLDGYYNGTRFHRLVPGFILQGGDPTGTGSGGESAFDDGAPFADEFHSRLKFNRRGLLGMANAGRDDNGSQFFLTLGATPELEGRNTMFGRVEGDTIFNVLKMAEGELAEDGSDRPLYPYQITGAEVLVNPFEDMVKRTLVAERKPVEEKKEKKKSKRKAGKGLLSFGGDEGEDGEDTVAPVVKKAKFNPKLVDAGNGAKPKDPTPSKPKSVKTDKEKSKPPVAKEPETKHPPKEANGKSKTPPPESDESDDESPPPQQSVLERTNAQIAELKASMKRETKSSSSAPEPKKSALEAMIPANAKRGRKRRPGGGGKDEADALDLFNAFKSKLESAPAEKSSRADAPAADADADAEASKQPADGDGDDEAALCDLHFIANCQSCTKWDEGAGGNDDEPTDDGWMSHTLSFAKDRLGKDLEWKRKNEEELVVIDPREKAKELGDKRKHRDGGRDRKRDRDRGGKDRARR